ncbi:MAG TPA: PAS domain-containing protein [Chthonomonadaceae bacterium]|nr:PAS domain-containing protein [Chthonomonadaceae bacterium]
MNQSVTKSVPLFSSERLDAQARLQHIETLLTSLPVAFAIVDTDLHYIEINQRYADLTGTTPEQLLGRPVLASHPEAQAQLAPYFARVFQGETVELRGFTLTFPDQRERGETVWNLRFLPLQGEAGIVDSALLVAEEVTKETRLLARQKALMEVSLTVSRLLDLDAIFSAIHEAVTGPLHFDRCALFVMNGASRHFYRMIGTDRNGKRQLFPRVSFRFSLVEPSPVLEMYQGVRDIHLVEQYDQGLPVEDEMHGVQHHAMIALRAGGALVGLLCVDNLLTSRPITMEDVEALLPFAGQAAAAIQNARLYQAERERSRWMEATVQAANHRIENNLQALAAIMDMQAAELGPGEGEAALRKSIRQVQAIGAVHALLSRPEAQTGQVGARELLRQIVPKAVRLNARGQEAIHPALDVADVTLLARIATALALVVQELCANAAEHAFRGRQAGGEVRVSLVAQGEQAVLTVSDNGWGFPPGFDPAASASLGLELVTVLVQRDLGGQIAFANVPDGGARVTVTFPLHPLS